MTPNSTPNRLIRTGKALYLATLPLVPIKPRREILFRWKMGYRLPPVPRTFNEKVQWRIVHDRSELIARGGDKLAMKEHAAAASSRVLIPETLWHGEDLSVVYARDFGPSWVLKPIGGSGHATFGAGSLRESEVDLSEVLTWKPDLQIRFGEWAYSQARPGYLVERRIETFDGAPPDDYRFFVFDGEAKIIQVDTPRFQGVRRRFYRLDWTPLMVRHGGKPLADPIDRPERLDEMVSIANAIGRDYDFIRVDLYLALGKVYFGEITPYPAGGLAPFTGDANFDLELGNYWALSGLPGQR